MTNGQHWRYPFVMPKEKPINRDANKFVVRLPEGMRDQIGVLADQSERSMNAEIVQRLKDSMSWSGSADRSKVYAAGYISAVVDLLRLESPPKGFRNAAVILAMRAQTFSALDLQEPAVRELVAIMADIPAEELASASTKLVAEEAKRRKKK